MAQSRLQQPQNSEQETHKHSISPDHSKLMTEVPKRELEIIISADATRPCNHLNLVERQHLLFGALNGKVEHHPCKWQLNWMKVSLQCSQQCLL